MQTRRDLVVGAAPGSVYLHLPAGPNGIDRVAGPFHGTEALAAVPGVNARTLTRLERRRIGAVLRVDLEEVAFDADLVLAGIAPTSYEHLDPRTDPTTRNQRALADGRIVADATLAVPRELARRATASFAIVIDGLFRHALCSMTRIVLSARWADAPEWMAVTTRDREKRPGGIVDIALLRQNPDGSLRGTAASGALPSSSAVTAARCHDLVGPGVLVHAHLLAAVIADRRFEGLALIDAPARSESFGERLGTLLTDGARWVLRRSEGIWCTGTSAEQALAEALACQEAALELLWHAGARAE